MLRYFSILLILCLVGPVNGQTQLPDFNNHLKKLEGNWSLISSSMEINPQPADLDTSSFQLEMVCKIGPDSLSVHCSFSGNKEIMDHKVASSGQELLVYDPKLATVYKLSGIRNSSVEKGLSGMFVTMGKGLFVNDSLLELTEFLVGESGPSGKHIYEWISPGLIKESSIYYDGEGEVLRQSKWIMKKIQ